VEFNEALSNKFTEMSQGERCCNEGEEAALLKQEILAIKIKQAINLTCN